MTELEKSVPSTSRLLKVLSSPAGFENNSTVSCLGGSLSSSLEEKFPKSLTSNSLQINKRNFSFYENDIPQLVTPSSSVTESLSGDESNEGGVSPVPSSLVNAQNYLSATESSDTFLSIAELTEAIESCENLILKSEECSEERRWLVRRLIELRYRLAVTKESLLQNSFSPVSETRVVRGHHFSLQKRYTGYMTKKFCERCCRAIWTVLISWYECLDCNYECHIKCVENTVRVCANLKRAENPTYEMRICPEVTLASQNYKCAECKSPVHFRSTWQEPRLCSYNGKYYCPSCHWNTLMVNPAKVIHNWDFTMLPVCRASYQLLKLMQLKPLISIQKSNSRLFELIDELHKVKKLREDILVLKRYLVSCRIALEKKLVWQYFKKRQYFLEDSNLYSLQDLIDINGGTLESDLESIRNRLVKHVKEECDICFGRGYICEICKKGDVIFPFDDNTDTCNACKTVYHHKCWRRSLKSCDKCERIKKRNMCLMDSSEFD